MGRSRIPVVISLLSILVAAGSVAALFSLRSTGSNDTSRVKPASFPDDPSGSPVAIDPAQIKYRQTAEFPVDLKKVTAIAVDADDHVYVAGDNCLCRYSPSGQLEDRPILLPFEPTCVAVGNRQHIAPGRIYAGFADHVEVFDPDGSKVAIWQGIDKARFTSISTGVHDVYIADAGWNVVQHFDTTGRLLSPIGENSSGHFAPSGARGTHEVGRQRVDGPAAHFDLVVGQDDLIYVVNRRECRIEGYNMAGELERRWGEASPAIEDFAGHNNPEQIAMTGDGRFVTAEENPLRVKVYNRDGTNPKVVCGPKETSTIADLAADRHNRILVLDATARCVRIFEEKKADKAK